MTPTDQAFYDFYTNSVSECPDHYVEKFIELSNEGRVDWKVFPSEYYSQLQDTYCAFYAGIKYGRANK